MLCLGGEIHKGTLVSIRGMRALGVEEGVTGRHAAVATVHATAILHVVVELLALVQEQVNVLLVMRHSSLLRVLRQHYLAFISVLVGLHYGHPSEAVIIAWTLANDLSAVFL